jgi:tellurite resistance protein TehA-like permease
VAEDHQESALTTLVVGISTFLAGIILVLRHLHVWRQKTDATDDPVQKRFLWSQLRRRCLTSTCIAILGFIISLFHFREYWMERQTSWLILVYCSLVLTLMIFFLAAFDFLAVSSAMRADREKTSKAARELAREYHRLKQQTAEKQGDRPADGGGEQPGLP